MSGQNENSNSTFDIFGNGSLDLGSTPMPDPFAAGSNSMPENGAFTPDADPSSPSKDSPPAPPNAPAANISVSPVQEAPAQAPTKEASTVSTQENDEPEKLLSAAVKKAEVKQAAVTAETLFSKLPVFTYAAATEEIEDTTLTFEQLRVEKSSDFPELDDGKRVSWSMEYCTITKQVPMPSKTVIGVLKKEIENSKEFITALQKAKDKNPVCKVKPRITAQSKGVAGYKGVFPSMEEADASDKHIRIVPARDGHVYEIRCTEAGQFASRTGNVKELSEIRAGYIPALPPVPFSLFIEIMAFFHYFMEKVHTEVMAYIYWDKQQERYSIRVPMQTVGQASISVVIPPDETIDEDRYIHVADIHSHNSMPAFFSKTDDRDELATRVYMVVGRLHEYPEICARISVGGRFVPIDICTVMDIPTGFPSINPEYEKLLGSYLPGVIAQLVKLPIGWQKAVFPEQWKEMVTVRNHDMQTFYAPERRFFRYFRRLLSTKGGV